MSFEPALTYIRQRLRDSCGRPITVKIAHLFDVCGISKKMNAGCTNNDMTNSPVAQLLEFLQLHGYRLMYWGIRGGNTITAKKYSVRSIYSIQER